MRLKERDAERRAYRPLNKREIDLRIEALIAELARAPGTPRAGVEADEIRPRVISARELVRRMRPFIVSN